MAQVPGGNISGVQRRLKDVFHDAYLYTTVTNSGSWSPKIGSTVTIVADALNFVH